MRPAKIVALGTAILSLAGCVKRDLEMRPDEGYVEIALDWTKTGMTSRSARYLFYNEAGMLVRVVKSTKAPRSSLNLASTARITIPPMEFPAFWSRVMFSPWAAATSRRR